MSGGAEQRKVIIGRNVGPLRKWLRLSSQDRSLLLEALMMLAIASLAILTLRFRTIAHLAGRNTRRDNQTPDLRLAMIRRICWAIEASAKHVPWRAVCFQQGLAAHWMLCRRGIGTTLYYGAAPDAANGLAAHVWVRDGNTNVIGCEIADKFAVLATLPPARSQGVP